MSDPRNVAHDKKVIQEKKHHGAEVKLDDAHPAQPGKKPPAAKKKPNSVETPAEPEAVETTAPSASSPPPGALEGSLTVLTQLKEMEFHSRANLERLATLGLTIEDELKQKEFAGPIGVVYSAQAAFQTKITTVIEAFQAECNRLQSAIA